MAAEDFFNRWSRRKAEHGQAQMPAAPAPQQVASVPAMPSEPAPPPTMEDVARLTGESDFSRFMGTGVDPGVKNSALKKLFAQPNFNVMDRLDIYIDDYGIPDPMPAGMLASLLHARDLLNPLANLEQPVMRLIESWPEQESGSGQVGAQPSAATDAATPATALEAGAQDGAAQAARQDSTQEPDQPDSNDEHPV